MIEIIGTDIAPALKARIGRRMRRALVGVQTRPVSAKVRFSDVNGPKGGLDVRCAIDVRVPRTRALHAEQTAGDAVTAFDQSSEAIARQVAAQLERRADSGRHPKKYYAARRLL
jgi:ribosome-associated translation inhibitor RaiA